MKHACVGLLFTNTFWPQRHERLPETPPQFLLMLLYRFLWLLWGPTYDRSARRLTGTKLLLYIFTDFDVALIDVRVVDSWQADNGYAWRYTHTWKHTHIHIHRERLLHTHNPGYKLRLLNLIEQRHTVTELQPVHCSRCGLPHCLQFWAFRKRPKETSASLS